MPAINLRATKGGRNMAPVTRKQKLHSVGRLLKYVFKYYPWQFALVLICIVLSAGVGVVGSYFLGTIIIDDYVQVAIDNKIALDSVIPSSGVMVSPIRKTVIAAATSISS